MRLLCRTLPVQAVLALGAMTYALARTAWSAAPAYVPMVAASRCGGARCSHAYSSLEDAVRQGHGSGDARPMQGAAALVGAAAAAVLAALRPRRVAAVRRTGPTQRTAVKEAVREASTEEATWEAFTSWFSERGGDMSAVKLARVDGIRGLVATRDIEEGESIIELPLAGTVRLSDASTQEDPSAPALALLKLMEEPGDAKPYFDLIPPVDSADMVTMPDFWTEQELKLLQCPPVVKTTNKRQELCRSRAAENEVQEDDLKWALCTVAQRSFTVLSPIDGLLRLMLPGIDLFNHDANVLHRFRVKWTLNPAFDGLFKVVAGSPVKKGQEIHICYGGNPNRPEGCGGECSGDVAWNNGQYVQRYGFIDQSLGTTMVDGKWLAEHGSSDIREALEQTTQEEDLELLKDEKLSPAARTAVEYRLHLKRSLVAQRQSEEQMREAREAKEAEDQAQRQREVVLSAAIGEVLNQRVITVDSEGRDRFVVPAKPSGAGGSSGGSSGGSAAPSAAGNDEDLRDLLMNS